MTIDNNLYGFNINFQNSFELRDFRTGELIYIGDSIKVLNNESSGENIINTSHSFFLDKVSPSTIDGGGLPLLIRVAIVLTKTSAYSNYVYYLQKVKETYIGEILPETYRLYHCRSLLIEKTKARDMILRLGKNKH